MVVFLDRKKGKFIFYIFVFVGFVSLFSGGVYAAFECQDSDSDVDGEATVESLFIPGRVRDNNCGLFPCGWWWGWVYDSCNPANGNIIENYCGGNNGAYYREVERVCPIRSNCVENWQQEFGRDVGACVCNNECELGDERCQGTSGSSQVCIADGNGCTYWGEVTECPSGVCSGLLQECVECISGGSNCAEGQVCENFKCVDGDVDCSGIDQCSPGQTSCHPTNSNAYQTCDRCGPISECLYWCNELSCGAGNTCSNGQCVPEGSADPFCGDEQCSGDETCSTCYGDCSCPGGQQYCAAPGICEPPPGGGDAGHGDACNVNEDCDPNIENSVEAHLCCVENAPSGNYNEQCHFIDNTHGGNCMGEEPAPFCSGGGCDETIGEDCETCPSDCGECGPINLCAGVDCTSYNSCTEAGDGAGIFVQCSCNPSSGICNICDSQECEFGCQGPFGSCNPNPCAGLDCSDGIECTTDACTIEGGEGVCVYGNIIIETPCSGGVCDGLGSCVECIDDSQCDDGNEFTEDVCVGNVCLIVGCGGGYVEPGETCDFDLGGDPVFLVDYDVCSAYDEFDDGTLDCFALGTANECQVDTNSCTGGNEVGECGDGVVNIGETCDCGDDEICTSQELSGISCEDLFGSDYTGNIGCDGCLLNTNACHLKGPCNVVDTFWSSNADDELDPATMEEELLIFLVAEGTEQCETYDTVRLEIYLDIPGPINLLIEDFDGQEFNFTNNDKVQWYWIAQCPPLIGCLGTPEFYFEATYNLDSPVPSQNLEIIESIPGSECGDGWLELWEVCDCGSDGVCGTEDDILAGGIKDCSEHTDEEHGGEFAWTGGTLYCKPGSFCLEIDTSDCVCENC